ncbi:MAG: lysozyme inhibitor LprI family protein [Pseudomonadota bacterium]
MREFVLALSAVAAVAVLSTSPATADPAWECPGTSEVEIRSCLAETDSRADGAMQQAFGYAREAAEDLDNVTERNEVVPALEASQFAWENYRDSQCDYVGATYGGGSGTGSAILACRIELTRARTDELMEFVN